MSWAVAPATTWPATRALPTIVDGVSYYWTRNGGGNPELEPWKANNFDLSFEKYFGDNKGYFAAAIYYKDIDTYIFNQSVVEDFTGAPLPAPAEPDGYVHVQHGGRKSPGHIDAQDERQGWLRARLRAHVVDCRSRCSRIRWMASASS